MNKTVQGLWIGSDLSDLEVICINSFLRHGHDFHLYAYEPLKRVPPGTKIKDANEILDRSQIFRARNGGLSAFSDFFRWELLRRKGGTWVDMDVVCLRPFDFTDDLIYGWESKERIAIGVLKFPENHFFPKMMAKACDDINTFQPIDSPKSVVKKIARSLVLGKEKSRVYARHMEPGGPAYFTKFLQYYDLEKFAKPEFWFYPFPYWKWQDIFSPNPAAMDAIADSYAVHVWHNAMHRDPNMDKQKFDYKDTLIGVFREKYL